MHTDNATNLNDPAMNLKGDWILQDSMNYKVLIIWFSKNQKMWSYWLHVNKLIFGTDHHQSLIIMWRLYEFYFTWRLNFEDSPGIEMSCQSLKLVYALYEFVGLLNALHWFWIWKLVTITNSKHVQNCKLLRRSPSGAGTELDGFITYKFITVNNNNLNSKFHKVVYICSISTI